MIDAVVLGGRKIVFVLRMQVGMFKEAEASAEISGEQKAAIFLSYWPRTRNRLYDFPHVICY